VAVCKRADWGIFKSGGFGVVAAMMPIAAAGCKDSGHKKTEWPAGYSVFLFRLLAG